MVITLWVVAIASAVLSFVAWWLLAHPPAPRQDEGAHTEDRDREASEAPPADGEDGET